MIGLKNDREQNLFQIEQNMLEKEKNVREWKLLQ